MHILKYTLYIITLVSCTFLTGFSQRGNVALQEELTYSRQINQAQLFEVNQIKGEETENLRAGLPTVYSDSPLFKITSSELSDLVSKKANSLDIKIPVEGFSELNNYRGLESELTMKLTRFEIQQANFQVTMMPEGKVLEADELNSGVSYRGVIEGLENSIASVYVSGNELVGMFSAPSLGNILFEQIQNKEGSYIVYNDREQISNFEFKCDYIAPNDHERPLEEETNGQSVIDGCFGIHFDVSRNIYNARGNGTTAYVESIFTHVATLYFNEGIDIGITNLSIWSGNQPFSNDLNSYWNYRWFNRVNASATHLLNNGTTGGVAYLSSMCHSNIAEACGLNDLEGQTGSPLPTYSWPVSLIAHELGHNFGSQHTHDCAWNGNNTPIDGCGSSQNGCGISNYLPPEGGTIMSYCHLQPVGINLSLGFGTQPGNRIRAFMNTASCDNYNVCNENNCILGSPCNDNDSCTVNDVLDSNCNCSGTYQDSDNDGVCDANDVCPGSNDNIDSDNDGIPDGCDGCSITGNPCNDGNVCTTNDSYDSNCNCVGTYQDSDYDGVCDANDVCPNGDDTIDSDNDGIPDACETDCECVSEQVTQIFTVGNGGNDVEESNTGAMGMTSTDLDLFMDDDDAATTYKIGLRYQNLPLSANISVSSAYLKFQVDEVSTGASTFNIRIENTTNSADFTTSNSNLSNRVYLNTSTSWTSVPPWNAIGQSGANQTSPSLANLLNALIQQNGAEENNAITLMITGTGIRTADSFDGNNTGVELIITYTDSTDCPDSDNDNVPDLCDVCPGGDDLVDTDGDGIPDFCDSDQEEQCNDSNANTLTTIEGDLKFDGTCYGVILESENGSCFKITIVNGGQLKSTPVNCDN